MPGRRKITDPDVRDRLIQSLAAGNYRDTACQHAGIHVATFYRWLEKGEADAEAGVDSLEREVCEAVQKAEADAENRNVALIARAAADGTWQAAAWMLERKRPDKWARRDAMRLEHTGGIRHDLAGLTDEQLDALEDRLR